jgi:fructose-specific phosphotransferase system IIC component
LKIRAWLNRRIGDHQPVQASLRQVKQYLLTGVSYVVPLIACGGILIALSLAYTFRFVPPAANGGPDIDHAPLLVRDIFTIGKTAFDLFPAVLAGFISYGIAARPGLVPGLVGGAIAGMPQMMDGKSTSAGFLGALVIGLLAGFVTNAAKRLPAPKLLKPVMPILIIPIFASLIVGLAMLVLNMPLARAMVGLGNWLEDLRNGSQMVLAMVLGAMIAFDMGGPVNKAAFFFGVAMIQQGNFGVMGACAAAICTPPLGLGLATVLDRRLWTEDQRESGIAALGMGLIGITEGAIPFAAADPIRVIPTIMLGSMVASTLAMLGKVGDHAPHGGPIVLPVVDNRLFYILAIVAGMVVTAVSINLLKKFTEKKI